MRFSNIGMQFLAVVLTMMIVGCRQKSETSVAPKEDTVTLKLYLDSANVLYGNADYQQSLVIAKRAVEMGKNNNDTLSMTDALSCVLCDYQQLGWRDSAIVVARQLLEIDKKGGDVAALSNDYHNIAYIYTTNKDYLLAKEFIEKAIEMEKQVEDSPRLAARYGEASEIYNFLASDSTSKDSQAHSNTALNYVEKAYELDIENGDTLHAGMRLSQKGDVLAIMHRLDEAEQFYKKAINLLQLKNDRHTLAITYRQLGALYVIQKRNAEAIPYLEKALVMMKEQKELSSLMRLYQNLHDAYLPIDKEKSDQYLRLYSQANDSLYSQETARSLSEFEARYNIDEEKAKAVSNHQLLVSTWVWGGLAIVAFIVLIVLLVISLRHRNKKNSHLHEQNLALKLQVQEQQEQLLEQLNQKQAEQSQTMNDSDREFMESVNAAIFELMENKDMTTENIAAQLCITSQQLRRKIKAIKDTTAIAYINSVRIEYAQQLLKSRPDLSVTQIGQLCGFVETTNFARSFKKETGFTPTQFREK